MIVNETFVDGLGNVAIRAAIARIELIQLTTLPAERRSSRFSSLRAPKIQAMPDKTAIPSLLQLIP